MITCTFCPCLPCIAFGIGSLDVIYDWHAYLRECQIQLAFQRDQAGNAIALGGILIQQALG
jgi:hypothetical protein